MKKVVLLLVGLQLIVTLRGQDTITEADTCYMFWPHTNTLWLDTLDPGHTYFDNVFWENIVDSDTLIYGISLRGSWPLDSTISISLAKKKGSYYSYCDTVWLDSSAVYRYFKFRARYRTSEYDYGEKCYEVYFHRPWPMMDTFYVVVRFGGYDSFDRITYRNLPLHQCYDSVWPQRIGIASGDGVPDSYNPTQNSSIDATQLWGCSWGEEFPIVEPNRKRCRKPSGLHLVERGNGWATLGWDGGSGDRYRVTVEGPDDTVVVTTADTTIRLDSLLPDANYLVGVQSMCRYQHYDYDSTLLNPGVAQMYFYNPGVGVDGIDGIPRVAVYPNPAKDRIVLESEDGTQVRGTLIDLAGREIITVDFRSSIALDVSPLASGPYLLRLTTPSATIVRKLLIQ